MSPVATEGVEEEGESKAEDGADEEEEKDELLPDIEVSVALVAQWLHIEDNGANHKGNEPDQVSPDVACKMAGMMNEPISFCLLFLGNSDIRNAE